jgi:hypothetical protein
MVPSIRNPSIDNDQLRGRKLSRIATVEGCLALLLIVNFFVVPRLAPPLPEPLDLTVGVFLWALAWLFSISGTRHGRGYGRWAAALSLSLLSLHALAFAALLLGGATIHHHRP